MTHSNLGATILLVALLTLGPLLPAPGVEAFALPPSHDHRPSGALTANKRSIKIPVKRHDASVHGKVKRDGPAERIAWAKRQAAYVRNKWTGAFSDNKNASAQLEKRDLTALTDVGGDTFYYAEVDIGTPAQTLNLVLDTGSSDLWVPTSACGSSACSGLTKYSPSSSSTSQNSSQVFSLTYGSGAVTGNMAGDTVTLAGYTVYSQSFAVASQVATDTISSPASGIMGFGFQELSTAGVTPWWEVLVKQGKLTTNAFTFQLARTNTDSSAVSSTTGVAGGVFTIGEIDTDQYSGNISYNAIPSKYQSYGYWSITLDSFKVNGGSAVTADVVSVIDTGTTLITAPTSLAEEIYGQISGSASISSSGDGEALYSFPCSSSVSLTLTFGGVDYTLNSDDFNAGEIDNAGNCLGAIYGLSTDSSYTPSVIIGDAFLKNVLSVWNYDQKAVGFASLKGSSAQTVVSEATVTSSSTAASSTPTTLQARQFGGGGGGGGFGGPPGIGGGGTQGASSTSEAWTSVSVQATQATGSGIYWASGISSPTAAGAVVNTVEYLGVSAAQPVAAGGGAVVLASVLAACVGALSVLLL